MRHIPDDQVTIEENYVYQKSFILDVKLFVNIAQHIIGNPHTLFHDIILADDDIIAEQSINIEKMEAITELLRKRSRSNKKDFIVWKSKEITPQ